MVLSQNAEYLPPPDHIRPRLAVQFAAQVHNACEWIIVDGAKHPFIQITSRSVIAEK
jgi:hypothetical protein